MNVKFMSETACDGVRDQGVGECEELQCIETIRRKVGKFIANKQSGR